YRTSEYLIGRVLSHVARLRIKPTRTYWSRSMKPATRKSAMALALRWRDAEATFLRAPLPFQGCRRLPVEHRISRRPKRHSSVLGVPSVLVATTCAVSPKRPRFPL